MVNSHDKNDISDYEITNLEELRKNLNRTPTELKEVKNINNWNIHENTIGAIKLLVDKVKICKKNLADSRKEMRELLENIKPDIYRFERLETDVKDAINEMLIEYSSTSPSATSLEAATASLEAATASRAPATSLVAPATTARAPATSLVEPATTARAPATVVRVPSVSPLAKSNPTLIGGGSRYYIKYSN